MKHYKFFRLSSLAFFMLAPALMLSFNENYDFSAGHKNKIGNDEITGVETDPTQYIGYGYNAVSGKALYEADALMLNNPILDVEDEAIKNRIKVFDGSKTEYQSSSSNKASQITEKYGEVLGGGGSLGGGYAGFNVDIGAKFNRSATENWAEVCSEEYSYYTIFAGNRPVVLQMDHVDLSRFITKDFKEDLYAVRSESDALNIFKKYGTHLLTGYTLGGIFEMTNYYATNSKTYNKENTTSFDAQVNIALGSFANASGDFSFTNNYGYLDNNKSATNAYKCTTYGGLAFPGLTIDQAFSWYETLGGAGYVYQLWTDSINAGRNLVIVNIPQSSKMVPLWDLLPFTADYKSSRDYLMDTFQKLADSKYQEHKNKYPDRVLNNLDNDIFVKTDFEFIDKGFNYTSIVEKPSSKGEPQQTPEKENISTYIDSSSFASTDPFKVKGECLISMDYDTTNYAGQDCKWSVIGFDAVEVIDERNGSFHIPKTEITSNKLFNVIFRVNGVDVYTRRFVYVFDNETFSGGAGTESSPYLISNLGDFKLLATDPGYYRTEGLHFKLINNLDFSLVNERMIVGNGDSHFDNDGFRGVFDGNNYTISNFGANVDATQANGKKATSHAIFFHNLGIIKNLNVDYNNNKLDIQDESGAIAGIATYNAQNGQILNCSVKNLKIKYESKKYVNNHITSLKDFFEIGGICAHSSGTISGCSVTNFDVEAIFRGDVEKVNVGGIAGYCVGFSHESRAKINKCQNTNFTATVDFGLCSKTEQASVNVGGICGYAEMADIETSLIKDLYKKAEYNDAITFLKSIISPTNALVSLGGILGFADSEINIKHCISINSKKIQEVQVKESDSTYYVKGALFVGRYSDMASFEILDSYVEYANIKDYVVLEIYAGNLDTTKLDITAREKLFTSDYSDEIYFNKENWAINNNTNEININFLTLDYESLQLNLSQVKRTFFIGDAFTSSGLFVEGMMSDGNIKKDNNFVIDSSHFDSSTVGNYSIVVKSYGQNLQYQVKVVAPKDDRLLVESKGDRVIYNSGDDATAFKHDSVNVYIIKENGVKQLLTEKDYEVLIPSGKFVDGNNTLTFKYKNLSYKYNVDAKEREIEEITVDNKEDTIKQIFNVGTEKIDFSFLKLTIHYKDKGTRELSPSECEFIFSKIILGKNTIKVTYKVHYEVEFDVTGEYTASTDLVQSFISAVNKIDLTNDDMKTQFKEINYAYSLYQEIGSVYVGSEQYQLAKTKLLNAIDTYNNRTESINNSFDQTVNLSMSVVAKFYATSGLTGLSLLFAVLFKRF